MPEAVAARHRLGDKGKGPLGHVEPCGFCQQQSGIGERCDHQPVPVGQNLVVEARAHACRAHGEQFCAQSGKPRLVLIAARQGFETIENVVAFEIALRRDVIVASEKFAVFGAKLSHHLFE